MRTNLLRHFAVALGLGFVATGAQAADYTSPAKWNNFNTQKTQPQANVFRTVGTGANFAAPANHAAQGAVVGETIMQHAAPAMQQNMQHQTLQAPAMQHGAVQHGAVQHGAMQHQHTMQAPVQQGQIVSDQLLHQSAPQVVSSHSTYSQPVVTGQTQVYSQPQYQGPISSAIYSGGANYTSAAQGFRASRRPGISPWFGGATLLFLDVEDNSDDKPLIVDDAVGVRRFAASRVTPEDNLAYDVHIGRYLGCGLYGLDFGFFRFDPDEERARFSRAGDPYRVTIPAYRNANVDLGGGAGARPVYDYYSGTGVDTGGGVFGTSTEFRVRRDLDIQGIEANLVSFGWMGAQRRGLSCNQGLGHGRCANLGGLGTGRYGGFGGPQSRCGTVQVRTSHGFRWFQLEDSFEFASDANGVAGYQASDVYHNVDTENNLFGYQFGATLNYCLTERVQLNVGGKAGLYGNNVDVRQRLGTRENLAYLTTSGVDDILTDNSDTVLSALCEVDFGLGYRLNNAWTITGGYRLLAASGVATAPGSLATDFSTVDAIGAVYADDSLILHGGYVGLQYNW